MANHELTREQAREIDRRAIEDYGIPSILLMENAGRACAAEVLSLRGDGAKGPVIVLCGPGNNGGDGFVLARTLWNHGVPVEVVFIGSEEKLEASTGDVATNLRLWRGLGQSVPVAVDDSAVAALADPLAQASVIVDALFGTGLDRKLRAPYGTAIGLANESGRPLVAVDVPSGLDANTGEVLGIAARAAVTVTFVGAKRGFTRAAGPEHCGRVVVAEIGIPRPYLP